jgi:hypothetical protein
MPRAFTTTQHTAIHRHTHTHTHAKEKWTHGGGFGAPDRRVDGRAVQSAALRRRHARAAQVQPRHGMRGILGARCGGGSGATVRCAGTNQRLAACGTLPHRRRAWPRRRLRVHRVHAQAHRCSDAPTGEAPETSWAQGMEIETVTFCAARDMHQVRCAVGGCSACSAEAPPERTSPPQTRSLSVWGGPCGQLHVGLHQRRGRVVASNGRGCARTCRGGLAAGPPALDPGRMLPLEGGGRMYCARYGECCRPALREDVVAPDVMGRAPCAARCRASVLPGSALGHDRYLRRRRAYRGGCRQHTHACAARP